MSHEAPVPSSTLRSPLVNSDRKPAESADLRMAQFALFHAQFGQRGR